MGGGRGHLQAATLLTSPLPGHWKHLALTQWNDSSVMTECVFTEEGGRAWLLLLCRSNYKVHSPLLHVIRAWRWNMFYAKMKIKQWLLSSLETEKIDNPKWYSTNSWSWTIVMIIILIQFNACSILPRRLVYMTLQNLFRGWYWAVHIWTGRAKAVAAYNSHYFQCFSLSSLVE